MGPSVSLLSFQNESPKNKEQLVGAEASALSSIISYTISVSPEVVHVHTYTHTYVHITPVHLLGQKFSEKRDD